MSKSSAGKMKFYTVVGSVVVIVLAAVFVNAQVKTVKTTPDNLVIKNTPAYAELLLKKVALEAEIEELLINYTEDFPQVKELRLKLELTDKSLEKVLAVKPSEANKLSAALGKLILQKIEYEAELVKIRKDYKDDHPDVKRAKRKLEIYQNAVEEILP